MHFHGYDSVSFNLNNPNIQIKTFCLDQILQEFKRQGIAYVYQPNRNYALYVNSIKELKNIQIGLTAEDGSVYIITLKPEQYSRKLDRGYQLLLYPTFYTNNLVIGYTALQAYYVGFDFVTHQILIAERADNSIHIY
ncbi:hypothetical protein ABPG72_022277 [Tetrahymena utriculariae]